MCTYVIETPARTLLARERGKECERVKRESCPVERLVLCTLTSFSASALRDASAAASETSAPSQRRSYVYAG